MNTDKPIKYISALATCGLRLYDQDGIILNDIEIWNQQFCTFDKVEWTEKQEIPDGSSIIGLTLGMAELD